MKKSDLRYGMVVKYKNSNCGSNLAMYLPEHRYMHIPNNGAIFQDLSCGSYCRVLSYDDNLMLKYRSVFGSDDLDIIEVLDLDSTGVLKSIWKRGDDVVMTISDIEKKLGVKNLKIEKG